MAERSVVTQEMEKKKSVIAGVEKKQTELREQLENDVRAATNELLKLEKQVELYIGEMEQGIGK